ncbi:MAG: hypothetical protein ABT01_05350 [Clostridium sp. SCN 57-10]|nr:MAG: hypothetical protein ABT01_05350 [Clostridium sp. SCN 57-10]
MQTLAKIAWPAILESVLISLVSLVDTMMVSSLGHEAIASVGLTTQPRFIVLAIFMSLNVGVTAVISRRFGEGDRESANRTLRQILLIVTVLGAVLSALAVFFAEPLLRFAGAQADTIEGAVQYFSIIIGGGIFSIISLTINAAQRGCGNTKIAMTTNVTANLVNIVFNYLLIGGHFGFPRLEVRGAAIATTLGYFVAFVIAVRSISHPDRFLHISFRHSFRPRWKDLSSLINVGSSAAVEQIFVRVGFFLFAKIIAGLGTVAFSTHQVCMNMMNLSFAFGDGLAVSASALVGQSLGKRRRDHAVLYGHLAQRVGLIIGGCMTVFFLLLRRQLMIPFSDSEEMIVLGAQILIILGCICPAQISQVIFSNCLRVAGDTRYVALVSLVCIGLGRTVVAYLFTYTLAGGLIGAWMSIVVDQVSRLILNGVRFSRGKWTSIRL